MAVGTGWPGLEAGQKPTCLYCGDIIGVYEPILVVEHDGERETSLAREPSLGARPGLIMAHRKCAPSAWSDRTD